MKVTHDTAIMPTGMYHLPSVKNPGESAFRPEVIRRKMGVAYDTYKPITDALVEARREKKNVDQHACTQTCIGPSP